MPEAVKIEARRVSKIFGGGARAIRALDDVSLELRPGEFFTLLGPSGCGKTTLLRLFAGFDTPTSGTILLDGRDITDEPPNRRPVNTVFQSYALFPHLTVAQNVAFGLQMLRRPKAEVAQRVQRMLALVRMDEMAERRVAQLSGGQQQRVALARALAPAPEVLLLDEPLSALDLQLRKEMQVELKRMQLETGITFVFVTHDQEEALTMSDRVGVMRAGRVLQTGTPREIYNRPASRFVASFIGESNLLPGRVASVAGGVATVALACGGAERIAAGAHGLGAEVTLSVRPEQVRIVPQGTEGSLPATVTNAVYFGTDTHFHLALGDGVEIVARRQSPPEGDAGLAPGAATAIRFAEGAVQVLGD